MFQMPVSINNLWAASIVCFKFASCKVFDLSVLQRAKASTSPIYLESFGKSNCLFFKRWINSFLICAALFFSYSFCFNCWICSWVRGIKTRLRFLSSSWLCSNSKELINELYKNQLCSGSKEPKVNSAISFKEIGSVAVDSSLCKSS